MRLIKKTFALLSPDYPGLLYYRLLCGFTMPFCADFILECLHLTMSAVFCLLLYGYTYRVTLLSQRAWKYVFIIYALIDVSSHAYTRNYLISVWYADQKTFFLLAAGAIVPYIPAYVAGWNYAFTKKVFK